MTLNQPPPLPLQDANPFLANYKGKLKAVRTQAITLGPSSTITIARIKIPSPVKQTSHLIRRFDTNAVSATSFFKCAFPLASDEEEENQMAYLHQIYDTRTAGALDLGPDRKLTGVWVPIEHATELAEAYGLTLFATPLIAFPDPDQKLEPVSSPTIAKTDEPANQPTPKGRSGAKHAVVGQTATPARSTKRPKVGPPSFGNTSPSSFNLSSAAPALDLKKPMTPVKTADLPAPASDSLPTSASTAQTSSTTHSTDPRAHQHQKPVPVPAPETEPKTDGPTKPGKPHGQHPPKKLMATEQEAVQAKEEALKLVSSLRSTAASQQEHATGTGADPAQEPGGRPTPSPVEPTSTRKRSLDEVLEEEGAAEELTPRPALLKKTLWPRSHLPKRPVPPRASVLPDPSKRNLAIAGIVIAGAAASIVPYFF